MLGWGGERSYSSRDPLGPVGGETSGIRPPGTEGGIITGDAPPHAGPRHTLHNQVKREKRNIKVVEPSH